MLTYARLPLASVGSCHLSRTSCHLSNFSNFCVPSMCVCSKYFLSLPHTARKYWEHPVPKHEFPVREDGTFQPCDRGQVFRDGKTVFSEDSSAFPSIPVLPLDFLRVICLFFCQVHVWRATMSMAYVKMTCLTNYQALSEFLPFH